MTLNEVLYLFVIMSELLFLIAASVYLIFLIYSWLKGAPYVPTQNQNLKSIIQNAKIHSGQYILELGCGDGRFLRNVALGHKITGLGVDINPIPIFIARLYQFFQKLPSIHFIIQDITQTDVSRADVLYIFLFPELVKKIEHKLMFETKNNALIISHGFKINYLSLYLIRTLQGTKFKTYYYKIRRKNIDFEVENAYSIT